MNLNKNQIILKIIKVKNNFKYFLTYVNTIQWCGNQSGDYNAQ